MQDTDLFRQVVQHIGDYLETDVSHLTSESRVAFAVPGLDSLRLFELLLYLEDQFDIEFDENVMEKIDTMADFVSHIELLLSKKTQKV